MKTMRVYPNPWGVHPKRVDSKGSVRNAIDRNGRPIGSLLIEARPGEVTPREFVGAEICKENSVVTDNQTALERRLKSRPVGSPPQVTVFKYLGVLTTDPEFCKKFAAQPPVEVPMSGYYIRALKNGSLLPGDGAAANVAGYSCKPSDFEGLQKKALESSGFLEAPKRQKKEKPEKKEKTAAASSDEGNG